MVLRPIVQALPATNRDTIAAGCHERKGRSPTIDAATTNAIATIVFSVRLARKGAIEKPAEHRARAETGEEHAVGVSRAGRGRQGGGARRSPSCRR